MISQGPLNKRLAGFFMAAMFNAACRHTYISVFNRFSKSFIINSALTITS